MSRVKLFFFMSSILLIGISIEVWYLQTIQPSTAVSKKVVGLTTIGSFSFFNKEMPERMIGLVPKDTQLDPSLRYNSFGGFVYHDK